MDAGLEQGLSIRLAVFRPGFFLVCACLSVAGGVVGVWFFCSAVPVRGFWDCVNFAEGGHSRVPGVHCSDGDSSAVEYAEDLARILLWTALLAVHRLPKSIRLSVLCFGLLLLLFINKLPICQ